MRIAAKRNSNIELLRCIAIFMIVLGHYGGFEYMGKAENLFSTALGEYIKSMMRKLGVGGNK